MTMHIRTGISIPVGPTRVYVSPSFTPNRSALRQTVTPVQTPRRPTRRGEAARTAQAALAAHRAYLVARQQELKANQRPGHTVPTAHRTAPVQSTAPHWLTALAMVLGAVVLLTVCTMAVRMTPPAPQGGVTVTSVSAPHTTTAHTAKPTAAPHRAAHK